MRTSAKTTGSQFVCSADSRPAVRRAARDRSPFFVLVAACTFSLLSTAQSQAADSPRVTRDLQALYTFEAGRGDIVQDRSGAGPQLDLKIEKVSGVQWRDGALVVRSSTRISSAGPAKKIMDAVQRSNAVTIEAWIKPISDRQNGPARIVSLSADPNLRNFTLGQDGKRYEVRLRTTSTSANGIPAIPAPVNTARTSLTHVAYARDSSGNAEVYINGKQRGSNKVSGELSNWSDKFRLSLANELTGERPWLGELHLIAIYSRALSAQEVSQNFAAGSRPRATPVVVAKVNSPNSSRISGDLQALYTFEAGQGDIVRDRSGAGKRLDLKIEKPAAVQWQEGALAVRSSTRISAAEPAKKIIDSVKRSNAISIEAWVKPADIKQNGPARVITLSADSGQRNFTLGQEGNSYEVRLRTTSTSTNGIPATPAPANTARTSLTHVVYTRDAAGNASVYVNGKQQASKKVAGEFSGWNDGFRFSLANELTGDRPWLGELHLVAIYSRSLSNKEVQQNFTAGSTGSSLASSIDKGQQLFEGQIAGLLANQCLECHDAAIRKGGLDLSARKAALVGGENGAAIIPGKAADSLLWQYVESNEMPSKRPPLSDSQKKLLREWIDSGAKWSLEMIDPVVYLYNDHTTENWIRRLTASEYIETVRSAVGVDVSKEAREILPPDLRADGFSNTAYNLGVDLKHVESYARLARNVVERMDVLKFAARFSKGRSLNTDATTRDLVAAIGKWLLRGPLDDREITNYSGIATTVASVGGDFEEGMRYLVEAMLQSPRFIYRMEDQRGSGTVSMTGIELASRLSYIIWGAPPDKELLRAADAGELGDRDKVEAQVRRMFQDPRAIQQSQQFISEWLNLNRLSNMRPNRERFPKWDSELARDMQNETLKFFKHVVWDEQRPLSELLNAQFTYATPRLAKHYGLKPGGDGIARYDLAKVKGRGGLLTHGSVLTIGGDDASMVTRGLFVMHELLRGVVKDPPPGIDSTPPPTKSGLTQRRIAEARIANVKCGGCHAKFEPLAFGLEKFDGIGVFQDRDEHGNELREDGEILFPGTVKPVVYKSSAELMDLMAKNDRVRQSITWKLAQFAVGRPLGAADAPILTQIHKTAQESGGTWVSTMTAIVMSDLVQTTRIKEQE